MAAKREAHRLDVPATLSRNTGRKLRQHVTVQRGLVRARAQEAGQRTQRLQARIPFARGEQILLVLAILFARTDRLRARGIARRSAAVAGGGEGPGGQHGVVERLVGDDGERVGRGQANGRGDRCLGSFDSTNQRFDELGRVARLGGVRAERGESVLARRVGLDGEDAGSGGTVGIRERPCVEASYLFEERRTRGSGCRLGADLEARHEGLEQPCAEEQIVHEVADLGAEHGV